MNTRTRIWKRTRIYFSLMIALYLIVASVLIMTAGRSKVASELLIENAEQRMERDARRLDEMRNRLKDAGVKASLLDAALAKETRQIALERKLIQRIRANEKRARNAKNEKAVAQALQRDYAQLRTIENQARAGRSSRDNAAVRLHWRMLLVVTIFLVGTGLIMFVLLFLILVPLEKIIQGIRRITAGDLLVDFDVRTADELSELAEVLKDLTTNFRELLVLIRNSYQSGMEIHESLKSDQADTRENALGELENLCLRLKELTEYFQFRRP